MHLKTFKCYPIFLNLIRFKIQLISFLFLFIFGSVSGQQKKTDSKEEFTNEFLANKRVHYVLKESLKKDKIIISDKDSLITNKPLNYSNERIKLIIDNKLQEADLHVQYYIINQDLAYVVLFKNTNEAISFIFVKSKNPEKWNFFDSTIRATL